MNTALAIIQPDELDTIQRAARMLAASEYFDGKGDNAKAIAMIATKILAGREMGFGPFASANGIHIIQGRPSIGANLMAAAVKSSGRYDYRVKEMSADKCVIEFFERTGDKKVSIGISEFTKADATAAGTKNMTTFARNMLFARAMSNGVRWYCPDVFSGNAVYVPEELGAEVDGDGNIIDVTPVQVEAVIEGDVLFEQPDRPLASQAQLNHMHALGTQYYGKERWEKARTIWTRDASGGAVESSKDLSPEQIDWVIMCLETRIAKRQEVHAQDNPVQEAA